MDNFQVRRSIRLFQYLLIALAFFRPAFLVAQDSTVAPGPPAHDGTPLAGQPANGEAVNTRIFGVLPNYRTADGHAEFVPLTPGQKLSIAAKDSFDWPVYFVTGTLALIYQAQNQNPGFGQGLKGYAKRYGAAYGDQTIGNLVAEGFLPVLLHEDPRYFRNGEGSTTSRIGGALRQIVIGRKDSGTWGLNVSEFFGGAAATGISNLYYPDSRTVSANVERFGVQLGNDAISNVLKEFWPDIKHRFFDHRGATKSPQQSAAISMR